LLDQDFQGTADQRGDRQPARTAGTRCDPGDAACEVDGMQDAGKPPVPLQFRKDQPESQGNQDRRESEERKQLPWPQLVRKQAVEQEEGDAVQQRVQ